MFDELELLRESPELQRLLGHYSEAAATDSEAWQDRLADLDGVESAELVRLHGLLLAFGWLAQNTGHTAPGRPGEVAACYRVTPDGGRALRRAGSAPTPGDETEAAVSDAELAPCGEGDASPPRRRARRPAAAPR
jgi:hypothetical protein